MGFEKISVENIDHTDDFHILRDRTNNFSQNYC